VVAGVPKLRRIRRTDKGRSTFRLGKDDLKHMLLSWSETRRARNNFL